MTKSSGPAIPPRGPGHCDDDAAWAEFVRQHEGKPRRPDMTDFALANRVFMADRNDLDLIVWQTAAKERIRWLSIELAKAQALLSGRAFTLGEGDLFEVAEILRTARGVKHVGSKDYATADEIVCFVNNHPRNTAAK